MDETYLRVRGKWKYLFRAVDKAGNTLYLCGLSDGIVRQPPDSLPKRYPPTEFQN
ncbi:DDE-type integrase/transposase/recombinase [uncultured Ruegeria sp.]|uniref:DDE-type integrase/transposase/recombinase n=1 Tax=uncultured Ruegeria sp. TaxID=259304 RepID=UPI00344F4FD6